ncbi:MAG: tetratricopeptide repeat protein [Actinomycetota bacterium]
MPLSLNSFVGRDEEVATVERLLGISRLVTLTGAPGVGKTRLALESALRVADRYEDRAHLVELAPLSDLARVPAAVATGLGVPALPRRSLPESLIVHLGKRSLLLLLDNCEHLIEPVAELVKALLESCPTLTVLATSREPLTIPGEAVWRVQPLPVPEAGEADDPGALSQNAAARLFADRASAIHPRFELTRDTASPVAEICRKVDGVPLAIELAASHVGLLTLREIAAKLDERLRLLAAATRGRDPRHRSLLACMEWSHELLNSAERALLRRLSVFAGGWILGAAEETTAGGEVPRDGVFGLLSQLVSRSLVIPDTGREPARYRMLETIREYGAIRLAEAGEKEATMVAYLNWAVRLAEEAEPELIGTEQAKWMARVDQEIPNLRAAMRWALDSGRIDQALRLITPLILYAHIRGYFVQARAWLEEALEARTAELAGEGEARGGVTYGAGADAEARGGATEGADGGAPSDDAARRLVAKARWGVGFMALYQGDLGEARPLIEAGVEAARETGDPELIGRALSLLADLQMLAEPAASWRTLEEAVENARAAADTWCLADTLGKWGWANLYHGNSGPGRELFQECLELARERGDKRNMRRGLGGLGWAALLQGHFPEAEPLFEETLSLARELGDSIWAAQTLNVLGELKRATGDYERACALSEEALELGREISAAFAISNALGVLGRIALSEGDLETASKRLDEAIAIARATGLKNFQAWWLQSRGEIAEREGDAARARELYREARSVAEELGNRRDAGRSLRLLAGVARGEGDHHRASSLLHEGLALQVEVGDAAGITETLEAIAGLLVVEGRAELAARLLGATGAQREASRYARAPAEAASHEAELSAVREALPEADFERAWQEGKRLSLAQAVAVARRGRGTRFRPESGWGSLTLAERDVATLAAQGLTNREIAERLFVSPATVKAHLAHIYRKLDLASRKQLALLAPAGASEPPGPRTTA